MLSLLNSRFGRLVVISGPISAKGHRKWKCLCDCGREVWIITKSLRNRGTRSCGCYRRQRASEVHTTHGMTKGRKAPPEMYIWKAMLDRCYIKTNRSYKDYGKRGITVCERWRQFYTFYVDAGPRPSKKHTIGRIDNDGNYEPDNVRWETRSTQMRNTRRAVRLEHKGKTKPLKTWCEIFQMDYYKAYSRLRMGWTFERTFEL